MKLTNIRDAGRFKHTESGREVTIKKGRKVGRSVDVLYYLRSGTRVLISDLDFYNNWKRVMYQSEAENELNKAGLELKEYVEARIKENECWQSDCNNKSVQNQYQRIIDKYKAQLRFVNITLKRSNT